ncbi:uncharacterized protein LOC116846839 [Odontomachus brunneus]|uniref:uncharacterized protein LOC116846839 n=1 Tax=Odontomachus brunneus TaxID=486640 RepID=UPI0013F29876|nr:uncharacterized protein LOC116846839 [Odontomachus brunneus]
MESNYYIHRFVPSEYNLYVILGSFILHLDDMCEGSLAVINTNWLTPRKTQVFWPPYKNITTFNKALKKHEEINEEKWTLYGIQRIFYETSFSKNNFSYNNSLYILNEEGNTYKIFIHYQRSI